MPEVDTSFYTRAAPATNPLATLGAGVGVANQMMQLQSGQQNLMAKKALSEIYPQAINPQTNQLDTNKLMSLLAKDPRAAWMAPEIVKQAQEREQSQLSINQAKYNLAKGHIESMLGYMAPLAAKTDLNVGDVVNMGKKMIASGLTTPEQFFSETLDMPTGKEGAPPDPNTLRTWLQQFVIRGQDAQGKLNSIYGTTQMVPTGTGTQPVAVSPVTGVRSLGSEIAMKPSIEQQMQRTPALVPGAEGTMVPASVPALAARGMTLQTAPGLVGGLTPEQRQEVIGLKNAQGQEVKFTRGQILDALQGPGGTAGLTTGPKMGAAEAAGVTAQSAAKRGDALNDLADKVPERKAMLENMDAAAQRFTSGPGADWKLFAKNVGSNIPFIGRNIDMSKVASQEEFTKLASQLALQQLGSLGEGTDAKLGTSKSANPSTALSNAGIAQIIGLLKGNEDAIAMKREAWNSYQAQNGPEKFNQFSQEFNKNFNPRVFQSVYLTPEQRADMVKEMTKPQQERFVKDYNHAMEQGWVPDPRAEQLK